MKEKVCTLSDIRRLYVRKKENFRQGEESLTAQLKEILGERIHETAIYHRYDVDHLSSDDYEKAVATVFSAGRLRAGGITERGYGDCRGIPSRPV